LSKRILIALRSKGLFILPKSCSTPKFQMQYVETAEFLLLLNRLRPEIRKAADIALRKFERKIKHPMPGIPGGGNLVEIRAERPLPHRHPGHVRALLARGAKDGGAGGGEEMARLVFGNAHPRRGRNAPPG